MIKFSHLISFNKGCSWDCMVPTPEPLLSFLPGKTTSLLVRHKAAVMKVTLTSIHQLPCKSKGVALAQWKISPRTSEKARWRGERSTFCLSLVLPLLAFVTSGKSWLKEVQHKAYNVSEDAGLVWWGRTRVTQAVASRLIKSIRLAKLLKFRCPAIMYW